MSAPLVAFTWTLIALTTLLSTRLARAARRGRSVPEALMAVFLGGGALGYSLLMIEPTFGASDAWASRLDDLSGSLFLLPTVAVVLFTWYVFRRDAAWARALAWVLLSLAVAADVVARWLAAPLGLGDWASLAPGSGAYWIATGLRIACFGWACVEAWIYYTDARKRVALRLTEPIVANRFLLWSIWSGAATAMVALRALNRLLVVDATSPAASTPLPMLLAMFAAAIACAAGVWLTFAPPAFYRRLFARVDAVAA